MPVTLNRKIKKHKIEATDETMISLPIQGRWTLLYFYPKDNTSGCTQEAIDFTTAMKQFEKKGVSIVGVSRESIASHQRFIEKAGIGFPLISDPEEALCQYFDVMKEKSMYGRKYMGIERSTFLIDPNGVLRKAWRKVKVKGHVEDVLTQFDDVAAILV